MKSKIEARILADSIDKNGNRITTLDLTFPRFILAELATHRVFSMNSASSRAIPFKKMKEMVMNNPFIPIDWQRDHKGMQGHEYIIDESEVSIIETEWLRARDKAVEYASYLNDRGVTKQLCNRLLEPFMWHSVILTGTDFENFFNLRIHPAAEIHINELAVCMQETMDVSEPSLKEFGELHIPFVDMMDVSDGLNAEVLELEDSLIKVSVARCARLSYQTVGDNPKIDYKADINLHDRLLEMKHLSPFEHVALCKENKRYANFKGWQSYRNALGY